MSNLAGRSNNNRQKVKNDDAMDRLVRKRNADRSEDIQQEFDYVRAKKSFREPTSDSSDEDEIDSGVESFQAVNDKSESKGWSLMAKSGYKEGSGLGAQNQGRVKPVEAYQQPGRFGLGHEATKVLAPSDAFDYDVNAEIKSVEEFPVSLIANLESLEEARKKIATEADNWMVVNQFKDTIHDENRYCDGQLIKELLKSKDIFDHIPPHVLNRARARANPYETIKAGFFQNRAAMKTANIDRIFDWTLSGEVDDERRNKKNPVEIGAQRSNVDRHEPLFYFADVCAGPGGFSEYMLWRKAFYNAKGFGFTLRGNDDFKLDKFMAAAPEYFATYYGVKDNGDVTDPENLSSLESHVRQRTNGKGVHLVMCDGGFSVAGRENIQEILSKRLYLCQFIVGLSLCRVADGEHAGGNFLCKLFDIFTPFSMGLIYLMYCAFRRITLHKPISSRPANSERYIFCQDLTEFGATVIKDYLVKVNNRLDDIKKKSMHEVEDVYEIVPEDLIRSDETFFNYVVRHNESTVKRQIFYLKKYRAFAQDNGAIDMDQTRLREESLAYWGLPNASRKPPVKKPLGLLLDGLTMGQLHWSSGTNASFSLDLLKPREWRHKRWLEFRAALLPESSEPVILISNGGKDTCLKKGDFFENLENVPLPAETILYVQITDKYVMSGDLISKSGSIVYILDAAYLNGDDISALPFASRLQAVEKFCEAVNKFNANRRYADFELICAQYLELDDLVNTELDVRRFKLADMAIFNITGQSNVISTCRGVRFVNIMAPSNSIYWSATRNQTFISDEIRKQSYIESDAPFSVYASFYDAVRNTTDLVHNNNAVGYYCDGNNSDGGGRQWTTRSWYWSWETRHDKNFSVRNVLEDEQHSAGITLKALRSQLSMLESHFITALSQNQQSAQQQNI